ncbi:MAG: sulfite exporter TauE/SafE family protein [Chloroflexota bacterium]|nr:sulfite exporter TauE/SafE family protein [Chloroflexota bacterium]
MSRLLAGLVAAAFCALASGVASAHPLGNFTVNRLSIIELRPDSIAVRYILDMAEIPALQEKLAIDRDRDGILSAEETAAARRRLTEEIARNIRLTVDGQPVPLTARNARLSYPPGQGGLMTLRLEIDFVGAYGSTGRPMRGRYIDAAFADRLGYVDVLVRAGDGVGLLETTASLDDPTGQLTVYPDDALISPRAVHDVMFLFQPGAPSLVAPLVTPVREAARAAQDAFAALIAEENATPPFIALALLLAMGLGAVHALGPGHGKAVVAAYLVGARGTAAHAVFLGATVTITHTLGVFALGVVTLFLSAVILPERLFPWLELISGLLVVALGVALFRERLTQAFPRLFRRPPPGDAADHARLHALGIPHHHDDDHHHHRDPLVHSHGGITHRHLPPGADGSPVTWRSLLALGLAGGLLPCPSALVVMLSAIALGRVAFGILLIVFFSIGLAGVLTAIGLALVSAKRLFARLPGAAPGGLLRLLPVCSAAAVIALGLAITLSALGKTPLL